MNRSIIEKVICSILILSMVLMTGAAYAAPAVKKDESVYVILNSDGSVKDTIVSDWLQGKKGLKVKDNSILKDIENVKGDEVPKKEGEELVWELDSDDLFYQGTTDKDLPLDVNIEYFLDGEKISGEDIGGKSGKVKIRVEIKNKEAHSILANDKQRTVYTPFVVMTVMNLSDDHFKDVEVNRGEVVSDGKNQVVSFATIPGLKDSLDIDSDILDLDVDEVLEVTAEVDNFDMGPIMIVASPDIPSFDKIEKAKDLDELEDGLEELKDAVEKLSDGADEIADNLELFEEHFGKLESGAKDLGDGIRALSVGIDKARAGALELQSGIGELGKGTMDFSKGGAEYSKGAGDFAKGAKAFANGTRGLAGQASAGLSKGSQAIVDGATRLATGAGELSGGATELSNGLEKMGDATGQLSAGQQEVVAGIDESIKGVQELKQGREKENKAMDGLLDVLGKLNGIATEMGISSEGDDVAAHILRAIEQYRLALENARKDGDQLLAGLNQLEAGLNELKAGAEQVNGGIAMLGEKQAEAAGGAKALAEGAGELNGGAEKLVQGANKFEQEVNSEINKATGTLEAISDEFEKGAKDLDAGSKELSKGAGQLGAGGQKAIAGADQLIDGLGELSSGANKLDNGASTFVDGSSQLGEGAKKLADGSNELRDGMHKFDEEGIQKIDDELGDKTDDLKTILDVKDELVELSKNYGTFSGLSDDMEGSVKFIMKTDEIEGNGEEVIELEEDDVKEEKSGFIQWIKSWFKK